jgi:hypothetical protein
MKKILTISTLLILAACPANAQVIKIHGHSQKTEYASPAEWLTPSAQCHIAPSENPINLTSFPISFTDLVNSKFGNSFIGHTHLDWSHPAYGEIDKPFVSNFSITLFHTTGHIDGSAGGLGSFANQVRDVVWDATNSSIPPVMEGNINEVKTWTGHFTFDPLRNHPVTGPTTPHGWYIGRIITRTYYDNGASMDTENIASFYSTLDISKPETNPPGEGLIEGAWCSPNIRNRPDLSPYGNQFGTVRSEYTSYIPLQALVSPWTVNTFPYSYASLESAPAGSSFPDGVYERRRDLDLHIGIPGILEETKHFQTTPGGPFATIFNPVLMGQGVHKEAVIWFQSDGRSTGIWAQYVIKVTAGGITTCIPPQVLVNGVCTNPTPMWENVTLSFQKLVTPGQPTKYRLCETPLICKEIM